MPAPRIAVLALLAVCAAVPAEDAKTDTIEKVYKSLQLTPAEVVGGGLFKPGDKVKIRFSLVNKTSDDLRPPPFKLSAGRNVPVVGIQQVWVERLGKNKDIPAIVKRNPRVGRSGAKYAAGGTIITTPGTIKGRDKADLGEVLIDTTSYPPGYYKVTMEYKALDYKKVLQTQQVDFKLEE